MNTNDSKSVGTHKGRYKILFLIFVSVVINYLDRTNIAVAASAMSEELELSSIQLGLVFSAFGWTYVALQIPGGIVVDRIRPRILYSLMLFLWSIATLLQGFVNSFVILLGLRASIGIFEAPAYPCNNAIVTKWFPEDERATAIAIYTSGQFIGLALLFPLLVTIQNYLGWRGLFFTSGIIGIIWAVVWYIFYRDPDNSKKHIEKDAVGVSQIETEQHKLEQEKKAFSWNDIYEAFRHRKLWGLYLGQFCIGSVTIFFLTWFPTYLVEYRGMDFLQSGYLASFPFLAAFVGVLLSGFISDRLIRKGYSKEISRKAPVLVGMLLSMSIIGANYTDSTFMVILFLALSFFGNGLASITWVFVSSLAPKHMIGLVGGVFNLIGGLSAVIIPILIGFLVKDGDFRPALFFIAFITFIGFLSFLLVLGKVKRIEIKEINQIEN